MKTNIKKKLITSILATTLMLSNLSAITVNATWEKTDTGTKYTNSKGEYVTGWLTMKSGNKYYFKKDGTMVTGWFKSGGKKYYFKSNGIMAKGDTLIENKIYTFDSEGVFISQAKEKLCTINGKVYYCLKDGTLASGMQEIKVDGKDYCYYFGKNGYAVSTTKTIDNYDYVFNATNGTVTKTKTLMFTRAYTDTEYLYEATINNVKEISYDGTYYEYEITGSVYCGRDGEHHIRIYAELYDTNNKKFDSECVAYATSKDKSRGAFCKTFKTKTKLGRLTVYKLGY